VGTENNLSRPRPLCGDTPKSIAQKKKKKGIENLAPPICRRKKQHYGETGEKNLFKTLETLLNASEEGGGEKKGEQEKITPCNSLDAKG